MPEPVDPNPSAWPYRAKLVFASFAIMGVFFLIAEHRAHVLPFLPWLFLAACPLMHMFMHRGHGDQHGHGGRNQAPTGSGDSSFAQPGDSRSSDVDAKGVGHHHESRP